MTRSPISASCSVVGPNGLTFTLISGSDLSRSTGVSVTAEPPHPLSPTRRGGSGCLHDLSLQTRYPDHRVLPPASTTAPHRHTRVSRRATVRQTAGPVHHELSKSRCDVIADDRPAPCGGSVIGHLVADADRTTRPNDAPGTERARTDQAGIYPQDDDVKPGVARRRDADQSDLCRFGAGVTGLLRECSRSRAFLPFVRQSDSTSADMQEWRLGVSRCGGHRAILATSSSSSGERVTSPSDSSATSSRLPSTHVGSVSTPDRQRPTTVFPEGR